MTDLVASRIQEEPNRLIYLDTTIWNLLCDQGADAQGFCHALSCVGFRPVVGLNAYLEMLKAFYGKRANSRQRARQLIACLKDFMHAGVPIVNSWEAWLVEEAHVASGNSTNVSIFLKEIEQKNIGTWLEGLLLHNPPKQLEARLNARKQQNAGLRHSAKDDILRQKEMLADLRSVTSAEVSAYLEKESTGVRGVRLLARYLPQVFREMEQQLPMPPESLAAELLAKASNRASHAIVRNDIYRNWRAANSRGITFPPSVPDDSYHVVNASYCDSFVTEDRDGQADAAIHAVPNIRVLVYRNRMTPVAEWLPESLDV